MSNQALSRIDAGIVLTISDHNEQLFNHSIVFNSDGIINILPSEEAREIEVTQVFDLSNALVMPGLVNAHGHTAMSLFRGLANDMALDDWLQNHIWPAEAAWVNEAFVHDGVELAACEMLLSGTTCFSDMYFFPEITARVTSELGLRSQLCCPILDFPTAWGAGPDEYIEKTVALFEQYKNDAHVNIAFGPHAPYTVSDEPLRKVVELAKAHIIPIQMHIHETQNEVDTAVENMGVRPLKRLHDLGMFNLETPVQAVHMTALNEEDLSILKNSSVHVVHCPESNMKLASGFCPVQTLLNQNTNVALGTDGAASNNDLDMFGEMRTAALIAKGYSGDASAVNARSALRMATINGAKALGLDDAIGSVEVGKQADLIAIDLRNVNTMPSYDLEADLVYNTLASQVTHCWVGGQLLMESRQLKTLDQSSIMQKALEWSNKIKD